MISLPPGCSANYPILIFVNSVTTEMAEWFVANGGQAEARSQTDFMGRTNRKLYVRYGNTKWCHYLNNGNDGVRLQFTGSDIGMALMFVLKFSEEVISHNLQEQQEQYEKSLL